MKKKYIFVSGGVISGLGKGISTASIALLLKNSGYKVTPIKFENYLNIDAGTINPIEHGDPFLCDDGTEADMDMGTYEKYLDMNMSRVNFVTMGQIYREVIEKERRFEYMGEDVQEVVHITGEIIKRIETALSATKSDIAVIELGGTAGEYQNILYYEASRMLTFRNPGDVIHVHVSYLPTPGHLGEPKTKPAQLSVRTVNSMGIQPDMLIARSDKPIDDRRKERLALFCNIHEEDVISSYDVPNVYQIPMIMEKQHITQRICKKLGIPYKKPNMTKWSAMVTHILAKKKKNITIAIVGKYFSTGDYQLKDSYAALFDAIDHAAVPNDVAIEIKWVSAEKVEKDGPAKYLQNVDGIIVPIGWGKRGAEGMIDAASYARVHNIPYLGLCYGMQLAAVAFARDVLKLPQANTFENDPKGKHSVIHLIPSQADIIKRRAYGGTMRLGSWEAQIDKNSFAYKIYNKYNGLADKAKGLVWERHRHRYEFNDEYAEKFEKAGMHISARSTVESLAEIIELDPKTHPFYIGIQGHPEYKSRPLAPHPLFLGFIKACIDNQKMVK